MSTFAGKAVLVTGAGTGIGYALCQAFASAGATVALNDIDSTLCQKAAQQINGTLGVARVHPYAYDVADVEAVRTMCQRFVDTAGRLDIAIANAGIVIIRCGAIDVPKSNLVWILPMKQRRGRVLLEIPDVDPRRLGVGNDIGAGQCMTSD